MAARPLWLGLLFLASALGENSLTITASRSMAPQPDQTVFAVNVTSPLSAGLDDVLAALSGSGITADNLSGVSSPNTRIVYASQPTMEWTFTLNVSFSKTKDTIAALESLRQNIGKTNPVWTLNYSGQGTRISPQLQAAQECSIPGLIADARAQAQKLADAAGATVGPILALSDASTAGVVQYQFAVIAERIGLFNATSGVSLSAQTACAIAVKFRMLRP